MANDTTSTPKPRIRKAQDSSPADNKFDKATPKTEQPRRSAVARFFSAIGRSAVGAFMTSVGRVIKRILRPLVPRYFINSWRELRQVIWPNRRETWRLTAAVFVFAIIFGSLVAVVDKSLDEIFKKVVLK